jgi:hypothetical protein
LGAQFVDEGVHFGGYLGDRLGPVLRDRLRLRLGLADGQVRRRCPQPEDLQQQTALIVSGPVPPGSLQRLLPGGLAGLDIALGAAHAAPAGRAAFLQLGLAVPGDPALDVGDNPRSPGLALNLGQPGAAAERMVHEAPI